MSRPAAPRPFPTAALLGLVPGTEREQAIRLGVLDREISRYKNRGALTDHQADTFATRIGLHPAEIWGDLWWQQAEQEAS